MAHTVLTGSNGFLGWHTRCALRSFGIESKSFRVGTDFSLDNAITAISGSSQAIHIAGANRGSDTEVSESNIMFAEQFSQALLHSPERPATVVYANSIHSSGSSVYGQSKAKARDLVAAAASSIGATFVDVMLPNLFGEHGRPNYNSVTATFCHKIATGNTPIIDNDVTLSLLHVQNAADLLIGTEKVEKLPGLVVQESVSGLLARLQSIAASYKFGEIPNISSTFDRDLFNTYRSFLPVSTSPFTLTRNADDRGSFFEIVRSHGGSGQSSFSTTIPGITRGDHFHRRKVERFTVLAGEATISMRRLFDDAVIEFPVSGDRPISIDMPTLWSHNIKNTGNELLYTSFWSNEIFDPLAPDTFFEKV